MGDRWIVTGKHFKFHRTIQSANAEKARVEQHTGRPCHVVRVKTHLVSNGTFGAFKAALEEIASGTGSSDAMRAIANDVLGSFARRETEITQNDAA